MNNAELPDLLARSDWHSKDVDDDAPRANTRLAKSDRRGTIGP